MESLNQGMMQLGYCNMISFEIFSIHHTCACTHTHRHTHTVYAGHSHSHFPICVFACTEKESDMDSIIPRKVVWEAHSDTKSNLSWTRNWQKEAPSSQTSQGSVTVQFTQQLSTALWGSGCLECSGSSILCKLGQKYLKFLPMPLSFSRSPSLSVFLPLFVPSSA